MTPHPNEETGLDATHPRRRGARSEGYLEGERRLATILFCDVQGSTSMAEQLDPEEWAEIMEEAFEVCLELGRPARSTDRSWKPRTGLQR